MRLFRQFAAYYRPYWKLFITDMICAIIVSAIDLAFPQILNVVQSGLFQRSGAEIVRLLWIIAVAMVAMYLVRYACQYFITSWGHIMGARMETDMREDLFDQLQRLSFSYYDGHDTGDLTSRMVSDLFDISELAHHGPENYVISGLKIAGSFVLLMLINVPMTLILLAVTAGMIAFSLMQNSRMREAFMDNRRKISGINSRVKDSLSGIRVVQSFGNEPYERRKFARSNGEFLESKTNTYKVMAAFHAGNGLFAGLLYTTVLVSGGYFIAQGTLQIHELAIYALYIGIFMAPIEVLINFTETFQKGFAGFRRFAEILAVEPDIRDSRHAVPLADVRGAITFRNVDFHYADDDALVLNGISLEIPAGQTYALVGPSGAGKTTLCSLIPRFYDATGGEVLVDGINVNDVTVRSLRGSIGIVQQDVYLFNGTIGDNIAYGRPGASQSEIEAAARSANIHAFIQSLPDGYATPVGEGGVRLSGGQKQRIAIARVFLKDPKILILDEATSALDNESELHIQKALEKLSEGRTTIVIAHRLSTIRSADRIVVMDGARIVDVGTHEQLMQHGGIYARYYALQFDHARAS
ncbi:MAG: ABC transporter ATP-binding protein [Clostridia bacterium]|nr:ABC transporter ATP-binding protein [Clostridia bacterium]